MNKFFSNSRNEKGQGLVEYAIILALVAIVVIAVMGGLGKKLACAFEAVTEALPGEASASTQCSEVAETPSMGLVVTSTFTACYGACTQTTFSCTPGSSYTISYTASSYGGETGSSPHHSCSGGGEAGAGNFYPEQVVTITDEATGQSQTYVVPHP